MFISLQNASGENPGGGSPAAKEFSDLSDGAIPAQILGWGRSNSVSMGGTRVVYTALWTEFEVFRMSVYT